MRARALVCSEIRSRKARSRRALQRERQRKRNLKRKRNLQRKRERERERREREQGERALVCYGRMLQKGARKTEKEKLKELDDKWPESIFHHVGNHSASYLLSVQCEVLSPVS